MKNEETIVRTLRRLMGLMISLMMLWACSSDDEVAEAPASASEHEMPIELSASAVRYQEAEESTANRRSWSAPDGYSLYNELYGTSFVNDHNLALSTIDAFLTHDIAEGFTTPNPLHVRLRYVSATTKWKMVLPNGVIDDDVKPGDYYAYGFVPRDAVGESELEKLHPEDSDDPVVSPDSYSDGAVLKLNGLKPVGYDACVIIGAREGFDENHDGGFEDKNGNKSYDEDIEVRTNRLTAGDFKLHLDAGKTGIGDEVKSNYLYFLFDHLCSALIINMKVHSEYHALRHIRLKKIKLETSTGDDTPTMKTFDVTVRLQANSTGTNPIQDITYSRTDKTASGNYVFTSTGGGHWLTTDYKDTKLLTHFVPYQVTKLVVTCTYDVYDWDKSKNEDGNLIRENCEATNTIPLSLIDGFTEAERGKIYTINLGVWPTYLYMMSDPDLDNPTITFE